MFRKRCRCIIHDSGMELLIIQLKLLRCYNIKYIGTRFFYKEAVYKEPTGRRPKYSMNLYY